MCCCPRTSDCSRLQFKRSWLRLTPLLQLFATPMRHIAVSAAVAVGLVICVQTSSRTGAATWQPRGEQQPRGGSRRRNRSLSSQLAACNAHKSHLHLNPDVIGSAALWPPGAIRRRFQASLSAVYAPLGHLLLLFMASASRGQRTEARGHRPTRQQGNRATVREEPKNL